jgi:hypothetical protein
VGEFNRKDEVYFLVMVQVYAWFGLVLAIGDMIDIKGDEVT